MAKSPSGGTSTKKAKPKAKRGRGRPSSYKPEYAEQARKLCLLGATDAQLADFFGYSEQTINDWKKKHPDFLESLKKGKILADAEVAEALYHRAKGYSHQEDKIFQYEGKPIIVPTVKHYPPDTVAAIIWLKNRNPNAWRDKPESVDDEDVLPQSVDVNVKDARRPTDG